jgi:hypothetical protein
MLNGMRQHNQDPSNSLEKNNLKVKEEAETLENDNKKLQI